jgi:5-methylcytosine-specific restriction enzyme subunit McrC
MDKSGRVPLKPDISWWDGPTCSFVADLKYKKLRIAGYENSDLYQLLTYCTAADLHEGLLIYAAGEDVPTDHQVVHTDKALRVVTLDLSAGPADILTRVRQLAEVIRQKRTWARRRRLEAGAVELVGVVRGSGGHSAENDYERCATEDR